MHKSLPVLVITILYCIAQSNQKFVIPDVVITPLSPKGLKVQMPDKEGIQGFGFHANINQAIKGKEEGTIYKDVRQAVDGYWSFEDPNIELKPGDILYYWVFVQQNRLGFDKQDQQFIVTNLAVPGQAPGKECKESRTTKNGGSAACGGDIIFEDNFNDNNLDESKWIKEQYIAWSPDYEFCSYEKRLENCYMEGGSLNLKTTVRETDAALDLTNGCTGLNCSAPGLATPVTISGKVTSRFSFRYGRVEVRAKLPTADWVYPQLYLLPKKYEYGPGYASGRIWIGYARGNTDLKTANNEDISNNILYSGPVLSIDDPGRTNLLRKKVGNVWGNDYHTYGITWKPDGMTVTVDGVEEGTIRPPNGAYSSLKNNANLKYASAWNTNEAPFDKEFVVSLGVGVGGHADFPDNIVSSGKKKPWRRENSRAQYYMNDAYDSWAPSWSADRNVLKIDYVKVWAL